MNVFKYTLVGTQTALSPLSNLEVQLQDLKMLITLPKLKTLFELQGKPTKIQNPQYILHTILSFLHHPYMYTKFIVSHENYTVEPLQQSTWTIKMTTA